jgi:hypothetical protein
MVRDRSASFRRLPKLSTSMAVLGRGPVVLPTTGAMKDLSPGGTGEFVP